MSRKTIPGRSRNTIDHKTEGELNHQRKVAYRPIQKPLVETESSIPKWVGFVITGVIVVGLILVCYFCKK